MTSRPTHLLPRAGRSRRHAERSRRISCQQSEDTREPSSALRAIKARVLLVVRSASRRAQRGPTSTSVRSCEVASRSRPGEGSRGAPGGLRRFESAPRLGVGRSQSAVRTRTTGLNAPSSRDDRRHALLSAPPTPAAQSFRGPRPFRQSHSAPRPRRERAGLTSAQRRDSTPRCASPPKVRGHVRS